MDQKDINSRIVDETDSKQVVKRLFLYEFPYVFKNNEKIGFEILNSISIFFRVSITSIKVVGSGQLGFSYFKNTKFNPVESDLDIAIIDPALFRELCEISHITTNKYRDETKFPKYGESSTVESFKQNIMNGYFRPDHMPFCKKREKIEKYRRDISSQYFKHINKITFGIYFSQYFFETKQSKTVLKIKEMAKC